MKPRTLASLLRAIAKRGQYGVSRTPRTFCVGDSYTSYYWSRCTDLLTHAEWVQVAKLSARYQRFVDYCTDVLPGWVEVERVHYMDNSTEAVQRDRAGNRRTVMVVAPHGDAF